MRNRFIPAMLATTLTALVSALLAGQSTAAAADTTSPVPPAESPWTVQFELDHVDAALDNYTVYAGEMLSIRWVSADKTWPWIYETWDLGDGRTMRQQTLPSHMRPGWPGGYRIYKTPGTFTTTVTMTGPNVDTTAFYQLPTITVLPDTDTPAIKVNATKQKPGRVRLDGYVDEHQSGMLHFDARAIIRTEDGKWMAQQKDNGWVKANSRATAWRKTMKNPVYTTLWPTRHKLRPTTSDHARNMQTFSYAFPGKAPAGVVTVKMTGKDQAGHATKKTLKIHVR